MISLIESHTLANTYQVPTMSQSKDSSEFGKCFHRKQRLLRHRHQHFSSFDCSLAYFLNSSALTFSYFSALSRHNTKTSRNLSCCRCCLPPCNLRSSKKNTQICFWFQKLIAFNLPGSLCCPDLTHFPGPFTVLFTW